MRVSISFQLKKAKSRVDEKCPVYIRCTLNGSRFELSTGLFLTTKTWDEATQQAKGRAEEARIINNRLDKLRTKIQDIHNQLESCGEPYDFLTIKNKLIGFSDEKWLLEIFDIVVKNVEARLGKDYSAGTLKHYRTSQKRIEEFVKNHEGKKDILLSNVDFNFLSSFDVYLKRTFNTMPNTALSYHKHLKKVLNTAISMNYLSRNPYESFKVVRNETNRDFLTLQEVRQIQGKKISVYRLELVRDIFVFACYTGLSYSDIAKLNSSHVQIGNDGNDWIIIDRTKTESRCRIPILPVAKEVLRKYENHPIVQSSDRLLPILSNQKMNCYLKELEDICGIMKKLTMHVARHTFATSVTLSNGVPIETVSKMLGHTSLKTTQIYAKIVDSKISNDMNQLKIKLSSEGSGNQNQIVVKGLA